MVCRGLYLLGVLTLWLVVSKMTVVTSKDLVEEVRRVAEAEPDYNYQDNTGTEPGMCSYFGRTVGVVEGNPCIIGKALGNLGVDMSAVREMEKRGEDPTIKALFHEKLINVKVVDSKDLTWLASVQNKQDLGMDWAVSVKSTDERDNNVWN